MVKRLYVLLEQISRDKKSYLDMTVEDVGAPSLEKEVVLMGFEI
jgi:hypothetical protein